MGATRSGIDIDRSPDDVWKVVGDFGGIGGWMPGIESCRVDGDTRVLETMGIEVTEELRRRDDEARVIEYAVVAGVPLESHRAVITVEPKGTGCHVTWDVEVAPAEMTQLFSDVYQQSLQALKDHCTA